MRLRLGEIGPRRIGRGATVSFFFVGHLAPGREFEHRGEQGPARLYILDKSVQSATEESSGVGR